MEIPKLKKKLASIIQKYKFVLLILCVGMILILLPTESKSATNIISGEQAKEPEHISQKELASVLSRISGAGRVEVLLATEAYGKTDYQVNVDSSASSGERITTVTVTDAQRNEEGLVIKATAPTYRGAIIICDGADDPTVHLSIIGAVSNLTGLRSDQISVLKMK